MATGVNVSAYYPAAADSRVNQRILKSELGKPGGPAKIDSATLAVLDGNGVPVGNPSDANVAPILRDTSSQAYAAVQAAALGVAVAKGALVANAKDFGAKGDGSGSTGALTSAAAASPNVLIPLGTYGVTSLSSLPSGAISFIGAGIGKTILACGSSAYGFNLSGASTVTFIGITFTGSTSAQVLSSSTGVLSVRFIDCQFTGFASCAVQTLGTPMEFYRCVFDGTGDGSAQQAFQHLYGASRIVMENCQVRYCYRGAYITSTGGAARDVQIRGCMFDGGWMYLKASAASSGAGVSYTDTVLTDTGASFGTLAIETTVRVMPVRQAGTITSRTRGQLTDTAANFTAAGIQTGDIIRTSTQWAVVDQVISATVLQVEEWLNLSNYQPSLAPAVGTAYTAYGLVIGQVVSNTSTAITVGDWRDWSGATSTPAASTLYEIAPKADYSGVFIHAAEKVRLVGNQIRRSWADQISAQLVADCVIQGNTIADGQDVGVTVGQPSGSTNNVVIDGNTITHEGSACVWMGNVSDVVVSNNVALDNGWMTPAGGTYGAITLENGSHVKIAGNVINAGSQPNAYRAIALSGAESHIDLDGNTTLNYPANDITINGASVTGVTGRFCAGTRILLSPGASGPSGSFSGTGAPTVAASPGSTYLRTDGGTGSTLYVKESGTGNTGWVAK